MDNAGAVSPVAAVEAAAEAAAQVSTAIENANANAEAAIEDAQAQTANAEAAAARIAEAALESERGRRIDALEQEFRTWQTQNSTQIAEIATSLAAMQIQITEIAVRPVVVPALENPLPLIPPQSVVAETTETIVQPANLSENAVAESPVPQIAQRRKRLL